MTDLQHSASAWQEKADFVIAADIKQTDWTDKYTHEQLAAKRIDNEKYILCSIPFAVRDMCLGDQVEVDEDYTVRTVVSRGGYIGFRIATREVEEQEQLLDILKSTADELYHEHFSSMLMAIAVYGDDAARKVADILQQYETDKTIVEFETIRS